MNIDQIQSLILREAVPHRKPYKFCLESPTGSKLFYYGAPHTTDPDSSIFRELQTILEDFKPDLIIVEGIGVASDHKRKLEYQSKIINMDESEVITRRAEPGFMVRLAVSKGVDWDSVSGRNKDEFDYLVTLGYSRDEVFVWYVLTLVYMHTRMQPDSRPTLYDFLTKGSLQSFTNKSGWDGISIEFEDVASLVEASSGIRIDENNNDELRSVLGPSDEPNAETYRKIWSDSALYVDRAVVERIYKAKQNAKKILVVFGSFHAVVQEGALRELYKV